MNKEESALLGIKIFAASTALLLGLHTATFFFRIEAFYYFLALPAEAQLRLHREYQQHIYSITWGAAQLLFLWLGVLLAARYWIPDPSGQTQEKLLCAAIASTIGGVVMGVLSPVLNSYFMLDGHFVLRTFAGLGMLLLLGILVATFIYLRLRASGVMRRLVKVQPSANTPAANPPTTPTSA